MVNDVIASRFNNQLLSRVYAWMTIGLFLTAGIAYYISHSPKLIETVLKNNGIIFVLILLQLALVLGLTFFLQRMSGPVALATFLLYSILNGVTLSGIFLIYTQASIANAFFVTAGMFGAMALYGFFTKADLSGLGNILLMGIFGLIIGLLVNLFFKSTTFDYIISAVGVILFALLTAYDVQQIKNISNNIGLEKDSLLKVSVIGALKLYLDFINLFLYILRFLGQKKDK